MLALLCRLRQFEHLGPGRIREREIDYSPVAWKRFSLRDRKPFLLPLSLLTRKASDFVYGNSEADTGTHEKELRLADDCCLVWLVSVEGITRSKRQNKVSAIP